MSTPENTPSSGGYPQAAPPSRPPQRPSAPPQSAGAGSGVQRPTVPPQSAGAGTQRPGPRPAERPLTATQRPAGARPMTQRPGQPGLVRPAPKAKQRRARLIVSKVDTWSVLKMAFLLSVALGIVTVVASIVLWMVLDVTGIFDKINGLLGEIGGSESSGALDLKKIASLGQVASFATIIAVVNVVLLTALSALTAVLYNISATLVGGIGVTLTDD
ncbi:hypothetical protein GCM10012320_25950 [Sinomonas cellulolyticus]|uniref:DUF3566 domain-containing protein n=1 Tax=Sinomonas cellulolyticus TaxID=2801916 RepID=A0ABS1K6I9_9MICC|nr:MULTISPECIES: DUF3566 domain-containing protein [Sinomonas]MBL0707083.1 DUF3566 domain-containing protein [Sinomonas cellulolyticus]GHG54588.1 hypothetical protein GCM10012320_25950 [Sinomonas sp. KCTC 49339]